MRKVEIQRRWEKLRQKTSHNIGIKAIHIEGIRGFSDASINIKAPIFAFFGQNGSGKTLLLRAIRAALDWNGLGEQKLSTDRLIGSLIMLELVTRAGTKDVIFDYTKNQAPEITNHEHSIVFIDTGHEVPRIQRYFQEAQDLEEQLLAYPSKKLNIESLNILSYAAQKKYTAITMYEVDDIEHYENFPLGNIPFFKISENGINYDSRSSSIGELSILYIYYKLLSCQPGSLILMEEPETFLSEYSQSELVDLIAGLSLEKDLTLLLTTHSPRISKELFADEACYLVRSSTGIKVASAADITTLKHVSGHGSPDTKIIFLEDSFARMFFQALCEKVDPSAFNVVEMAGQGGAEALKAVRKNLPTTLKQLRFAYVFDGDMRSDMNLNETDISFLPSDVSPEKFLRDFICNKTAEVSKKLGITTASLEGHLMTLHGRDDHDWFPDLAQNYGLTIEVFIRIIVDCWICHAENTETAKNLITRIKAHLFQ